MTRLSPGRRAIPYVTVPEGWAARWQAARAESGTRLVRALVVGASLAIGENATSQRARGYIGLTAAELQGRGGDGGSGFLGAAHRTGANPGSGPVTTTGAWSDVDNEGGPCWRSLRPTVAGNGATITFPVRGTTVEVHHKSDPAFGVGASWAWTIDAVPQTPLDMDAAVGVRKVTVSGLAPGVHNVVVTVTTGDGRIWGARGLNAAGVVVDNVSVGGMGIRNMEQATTGLATTDPADNTVIGRALAQLGPVDLVVLALAPNEAVTVSPDPTVLDDIRDALDIIRAKVSVAGPTLATPPAIVWVTEHIGNADIVPGFALYDRGYAQVAAIGRQWAETVGAAHVDLWALGGHAHGPWAALDYFADGTTVPTDAEPIHLSDAGHAAAARPLIDLLGS